MSFDASREILAAHFSYFDKIVEELKYTKTNLEEYDTIYHLLLTMPIEYDVIITALFRNSLQTLSRIHP